MRFLTTVLAIVSLCAVPAASAEKAPVEIPITKVVLFSSGVGYFEHTGAVEGDAVATLRFKTDQINDVLKSMVLQDLGGGTIAGVNYASRDPLTRALKSFAVDISGRPSLAQLLDQLRGAEVVLSGPAQISGKILGVEEHKRQVLAGGGNTIVTETLLNVVTDKGIQSVPLTALAGITLTDPKLSGELNKALELLISSHDTQRKAVEIRFTGEGVRQVRIGYVIETPVWKTSYRLDLSGDKPLLQGWAIVENTTDNDWSGVKLAMVSGRPISFRMDLYTPLYLARPIVHPELYASLRPRVYEEGMTRDSSGVKLAGGRAEDAKRSKSSLARAGLFTRRLEAPQSVPAAAGEPLFAGGISVGKSVRPLADAGRIGELFRFDVTAPVHLSRRGSAMLPIVNKHVPAERVSIYNQATLARHPLNGVALTNDTGMKLMAGPVTVFDGGMYAGDARIGHFAPGDKRLLSYAVDLDVTVDPSAKSSAAITGGKIVRGVLTVRRMRAFKQTYAIKNKADQLRKMIVEHPFRPERKLIEPAKYDEKTPTLYRFAVDVPAGKTRDFTVRQRQEYSETIVIMSRPTDSLLFYSRSGQIPQSVRDALGKAIEMKNELARLQSQLAKLEKEKKDIETGQQRLLQQIRTLGVNHPLSKRHAEKLSAQETQIEQLHKAIEALRISVTEQQNKLADYLGKLNVK